LSLGEEGKAYGGKAKTSNRTGEIPPSGIIGGASENATLVEMCSHLATERAGMGTLHLTVSASELYPNPNGNGEQWIGRTYGAMAPVLNPTGIGVYNKKILAHGTFLNLYTIGYGVPEGYAIAKDGQNVLFHFSRRNNRRERSICAEFSRAPGARLPEMEKNWALWTQATRGYGRISPLICCSKLPSCGSPDE
jgi:hypothetical protein